MRAACITAAPIVVAPSAAPLLDEIDRVARAHRASYDSLAPSQIDELGPARRLYRHFGIDPTKTRPSSESLLRRVLAGKPFPRISNAVDLSNLLALRFLLPIGLYDRDKLVGPVVLRRGRPGEVYAGIRKAEVHLEGRPVVADERGPFGNPTSDSLRTSIEESTASLLLIVFAPAEIPVSRLVQHADVATEAMATHLAGVAPVDTRFAVIGDPESQ